jgi:hypothetical protein
MPTTIAPAARSAGLAAVFLLISAAPLTAQGRREVAIPDIPGFVVLACELHIHTVFSDGNVWPTVRVEEAWLDGLDVLAVTDHVEYHPHKDDIPVRHHRPFEIAAPPARALGLIPLRAAEITRKMPPGHFNALFVEGIVPLEAKEWKDSLEAAAKQGAFIFWNHPTFPQPEGKAVWYPEHEELFVKGRFHGIEVVNGETYYPESHRWCLEKGLTMLANSDSHNPIGMSYGYGPEDHRPMTLVLAREKSLEAVREALFGRRTVVWYKDKLIGRPEHLRPIFDASIEVLTPEVRFGNKESAVLQLRNRSDVPLNMSLKVPPDLVAPANMWLTPGHVGRITIRAKPDARSGKREIEIPCEVDNFLVTPEKGLPASIRLKATVAIEKSI